MQDFVLPHDWKKEDIMKTQFISASSSMKSTKYMVELALMIAVTLVMAFTPLGYIKLPLLSASLLTIPVAVAAVMLGPVGGLTIGLVFGLTSFYMALTGSSALAAQLMAINPVFCFLQTVGARAIDGLCCGLIFKAMHNNAKTAPFSYYVASFAAPVLNTVFFMGIMMLCYYNTEYIQGFVTKFGVNNPFSLVVAMVGVQGLLEAVVCTVIGSILSRVLFKVMHAA